MRQSRFFFCLIYPPVTYGDIPPFRGDFGAAHKWGASKPPIGVPAEAQPIRWVRWGKEEQRSDQAFRL